jgi:hypothetical protein
VAVATTVYHSSEQAESPRRHWRGPAWPLTALYMFFPLWWVLGVSHIIFLLMALVMAMKLLRRRPIFVPTSFGLWLLFLIVVVAGAGMLWVHPPGTVAVNSLGKLFPYSYRLVWYLAITVVAVYVVNMSERDLPTVKVMRSLSWMFVYTLAGGLAGLTFPHVDFPSALELVLPVGKEGFIYSLVHPSIVSASDFLGYEQARPTAPFAYANAWGNNFGLFLPFFIGTWLAKDAGWRRPVGCVLLALAIIPIAYSLNRGLWGGLIAALLLVSVKMAMMGRVRVLQVTVALLAVGAIIFVSSPLYDTVTLRINTPHSNERRGTVASEVINTTLEMSPLIGYGDTRAVSGSFSSIAGGETPDCHQCAAPPLGTQGFMWRLIFTGSRDPVALIGCTAIFMGLIFSFVYDSLESPLFTIMIAIGLMNRRFVRDRQLAATGSSGGLG